MEKEAFYAECAAILNVDYKFVEALPYRRRWGQRTPGNGRLEGIGLIRYFGPSYITVTLRNPNCSRSFRDIESVFIFLKTLVS